jgi:hypothetical protein
VVAAERVLQLRFPVISDAAVTVALKARLHGRPTPVGASKL